MSRLLNLPALGATLVLLTASLIGAATPASAASFIESAVAEEQKRAPQKCLAVKVSDAGPRAGAAAIKVKYIESGGGGGLLGCAKGAVRSIRGGGLSQQFQGGAIYWAPRTGAHRVHGSVRKAWAAVGGENGRLGVPTGDLIAVPGSVSQPFNGGRVIVRSSGKVTVNYNGLASILGRGAVTQPWPLPSR